MLRAAMLSLVVFAGCSHHTCNHLSQPSNMYVVSGNCGPGGAVVISGKSYQSSNDSSETCVGIQLSTLSVLGLSVNAVVRLRSNDDELYTDAGFTVDDAQSCCNVVPVDANTLQAYCGGCGQPTTCTYLLMRQ
jgi:hypothetical protein